MFSVLKFAYEIVSWVIPFVAWLTLFLVVGFGTLSLLT